MERIWGRPVPAKRAGGTVSQPGALKYYPDYIDRLIIPG